MLDFNAELMARVGPDLHPRRVAGEYFRLIAKWTALRSGYSRKSNRAARQRFVGMQLYTAAAEFWEAAQARGTSDYWRPQ